MKSLLEIYNDKEAEWTQFYPVDVNTNEAYERTLENLPGEVTGKYMGGIVGYTPVWFYTTIQKSRLRETRK